MFVLVFDMFIFMKFILIKKLFIYEYLPIILYYLIL